MFANLVHDYICYNIDDANAQPDLGIDHKYWDRQAWANSEDPDQNPQNAASDHGLHCLPLFQQFLHITW